MTLEKLAAAHGLSHRKLALIAGVSHTAIGDWIKGKSTPTVDRAIALADYFGLTLDELAGRAASPSRDHELYRLIERYGEDAILDVVTGLTSRDEHEDADTTRVPLSPDQGRKQV